jgi:hypothetical protein
MLLLLVEEEYQVGQVKAEQAVVVFVHQQSVHCLDKIQLRYQRKHYQLV